MKTAPKLETAKGSMDPLPSRIHSQVLPHACAHLYRAARQGAYMLPRPHIRTKLNPPDRWADLHAYARNLPVRIRLLGRHASRVN
jgi:hypothetical protein